MRRVIWFITATLLFSHLVGARAAESGVRYPSDPVAPRGSDEVFSWGSSGPTPVVGAWNGNGSDTPGLYGATGGTPTSPATVPPRWLVLLYMAGDDVPRDMPDLPSLTPYLQNLLSSLHALPPTPAMSLAVLYDGKDNGDSRVYLRTSGGLWTDATANAAATWNIDPNPTGDYEFNTGKVESVRNFITYARDWARDTYGAAPEYTFLSLIDHGGGWAPDIPDHQTHPGSSGTVQTGGWRGMSMDLTNDIASHQGLSTRDTARMLQGLEHIDVLFFDACLMGMVESAYEIMPYASYFIASQSLAWSQLPYRRYLDPTVLTRNTTPRELAAQIVARYNQPAYPSEPFTIAAIDTAKLTDVVTNTEVLAKYLLAALPPSPVPLNDPTREALTRAYRASQKFDYDSSYTIDPTDGYVDLADFAIQLLRAENHISPDVDTAARALVDAIGGRGQADRAIVATRGISGTAQLAPDGQPWTFAGAHGLSIYLPLGEQDNRPMGRDMSGEPIPVPQLSYYASPAHLTFTKHAPQWAELLVRLEANTPQRTRLWRSPRPAESVRYLHLPVARS